MGSESGVEYIIRIVTTSSCLVLILRSARSVRFQIQWHVCEFMENCLMESLNFVDIRFF